MSPRNDQPPARGPDRAAATDVIDEAIAQWRRERPDLDPSPMSIFGRTARIFSLQRNAQAAIHQRYGINHAAFDVLANLRRSGAPHRKTASSLAESSLITTGAVTFRLDGLEAAGLLRRVRDEQDRRVVHAELTPEGLQLIDEVIAHHLDRLAQLLGSLSADEQVLLAELLGRLEASMHQAMGA